MATCSPFSVLSCMSCAFVKNISICFKQYNLAFANNDETLFSERFLSFTDEDVEKFLELEENKNTRRKTESYVALVSCKLLIRLFLIVQ